ncbi:MAG: hypothetical protein ACTSWV_02665 [Candidatus Asgardarchaeia archaeon]
MRVSTLFKVFAIIINIVMLLTLVSAVVSVTSFSFNVVDAEGGMSPSGISMNMTIEVNNGGYWELQDIFVRLNVTDPTGKVIASSEDFVGDLGIGTNLFNVSITIEPEDLFTPYLITHDSQLNFTFIIGGKYTVGLFEFKIMMTNPMEWDAPMDSLNITYTTSSYNTTHDKLTAEIEFNSPYYDYYFNATLQALSDGSILSANMTSFYVPFGTYFSGRVEAYVPKDGTFTKKLIIEAPMFEYVDEEV